MNCCMLPKCSSLFLPPVLTPAQEAEVVSSAAQAHKLLALPVSLLSRDLCLESCFPTDVVLQMGPHHVSQGFDITEWLS